MPILLIISVALQIACLIHAARNNAPFYWFFILIGGSYIGVGVYFFVFVLPDIRSDPRSRQAVKQVIATFDPERQRRHIQQQLEIADTIQNRVRLAEECMRLKDYADAAMLYRSVLKGMYATDGTFMLGLAQALVGLGQYAEARETLDALIAANPDFQSTEGHLLYARCLEELGESGRALAEYEVLVRSYPGEEARLRHARLLVKLERFADARTAYQDMLKRAKIAPSYYRKKEKEFLAAAQRELAALGPG